MEASWLQCTVGEFSSVVCNGCLKVKQKAMRFLGLVNFSTGEFLGEVHFFPIFSRHGSYGEFPACLGMGGGRFGHFHFPMPKKTQGTRSEIKTKNLPPKKEPFRFMSKESSDINIVGL